MWEQKKEEIGKGGKEAAGKRLLYIMLEFSLWLQRTIIYTRKSISWDKDLSLKIIYFLVYEDLIILCLILK